MDKRLLTILRCPVTHKGLNVARSDMLARINAAIESGGLANRDGAQRNCEIQHLRMQVAFGERHQHRQRAHEKRQREAVQQAQAGEPDRGAIEPVRRIRGCLIHEGMPLCWNSAARGAAEMK